MCSLDVYNLTYFSSTTILVISNKNKSKKNMGGQCNVYLRGINFRNKPFVYYTSQVWIALRVL